MADFRQHLTNLLTISPFKVGFLVVLIAAGIFFSFKEQKPLFLVSLDNRISDAMFRWRGPLPVTGQVVIVDIDEKSLRRLGQWPWPRTIVADLVQKVHQGGAKAIGLDIVFAEPDRTSPKHFIDSIKPFLLEDSSRAELEKIAVNEALDNDVVLGNVVAEAPTVLGYVFLTKDDGLKAVEEKPFPSINIRTVPEVDYHQLAMIKAYRPVLNVPDVAQAETEGFFNIFADPSGMVREVPLFMALDGIPYPSLALETLRLGAGALEATIHVSPQKVGAKNGLRGVSLADRFIPTDDFGQMAINFRGPEKTFTYVSAIDVLDGKSENLLRDKYVLVGTSAKGLLDIRATPFSSAFPGVEVQATIIDNILVEDSFTYDVFTEIGLTYTLIVVGGLLLSSLLAHTSPVIGATAAIFFVVATVLGDYYFFFLRNQLVGITYPLVTLGNVCLLVTMFNYFLKDREKKFIYGAFSRYVSPKVIGQLVKNPDKLLLAGEQKELTVLFSDIRGFTTISEQLEPGELANFMNEYFTAMSEVILRHKGMVDKFIGDAIMAIWGAPLPDEDNAANAIRAAVGMMERLRKLQTKWERQGLPKIDIGIGINTGLMSVGNFGSDQRFDYTVMGDNVNLASRLEGLNKVYGTNIIISESTKAAVGDRFLCRFFDMVRVKGKERPVKIYEPLGVEEYYPALPKQVEIFEQAVADYRKRNFEQAQAMLEKLFAVRPLRLYGLYLERIEAFKKNPPPEDWDGVFVSTTK